MPKRKAAAVGDPQAGEPSRSTIIQQSIYAFSSLAKPGVAREEAKKRKIVHTREETPPPVPLKKATAKQDSKRKRKIIADDAEDEVVASTLVAGSEAHIQHEDVFTRRNKRLKKNALPPTPDETPSKSAAALFDKLNLAASSRAIPISFPRKGLDYHTPPETPADEVEIDLPLPSELEDLQDLHASFLTALSMYYSHNGTSTGVEIAALLPMITKHWKKRAVTLEDVQRILAVVPAQDRRFALEDHGRASLRLSRTPERGRALTRTTGYIGEADLNHRFEQSLHKAWHNWQARIAKEDRTATAFLEQLALLQPTRNQSSQKKVATLFTRGEQRLADLKACQSARLEEKAKIPPTQSPAATTTPSPAAQSVQSRSTALLERIVARQNLASTLPARRTKAQLERRYALQRIEEIARVLSLMCGMKDRSSFSMQIITQQLQQSLRNPISSVEVWRCLSLMATEIMPNFVRLVQSGEVQGVVVTRSGSVPSAELRARVEQACA